MLKTLWNDFIALMWRRPDEFQVAALCYRRVGDVLEALLITSLSSGRWILPKGWPQDGHDGPDMALKEAWEEAGIIPASQKPKKVGLYHYVKRLKGDVPVRTEVHVYAVEVESLTDDYPEAGRRQRRWLPLNKAAHLVEEPELRELLLRAGYQINA